jgi:hypothetical protein
MLADNSHCCSVAVSHAAGSVVIAAFPFCFESGSPQYIEVSTTFLLTIVVIVRRVCTPHNQHISVSTHPRHQPAETWLNTTRYCKYSQVLLMMVENIARRGD